MTKLLFKLWRWLPIPFWAEWRFIWCITQKFLVGAIAVIFDREGKILLFQHTYRRKYPWGLPGGWLKYGEDADQAIKRELQEEAGFTIHVKKPLLIGRSKEYPRIDLVFLCEYRQGEFRPSAEVSEAHFFEIEALSQLLKPEEYDLISHAITELNKDQERS
jgi:ADP-ribose pyrophosphatase YjhB (NUDIX family)